VYFHSAKNATGKQAFGVTSKSSEEPAKGVIFPELTEEMVKGEEIYKRSHGNFAPGEQKHRGYQWPVDPSSFRFGVKGDSIAFNGVSQNIADVLNSAGEKSSIVSLKPVSVPFISFFLTPRSIDRSV